MISINQALRATQFRKLHEHGHCLLANAWDAASARVFERAGFKAIGTTSAGIANARGFPDGEFIGRAQMLREIQVIADAVSLPVTTDIEAGYGHEPADVAQTVAGVLDLGAVGINLEDRVHQSDALRLYEIHEQVSRIEAAREACERRGIAVMINARTDAFLLPVDLDSDARLALAVQRGNAYLRAGADIVFVPGVVDLDMIRRLASGLGGPLSIMAMPGAPAAADMFAAGACRVSLGNSAMLAALGALNAIAIEVMKTGTWETIARTFYGFREAEALFDPSTSQH